MLKTWVEIDQAAIRHNFLVIKALVKPKTKIFAVVKSNAYGHGLLVFSKIADKAGVDGFCVDSVIEGVKLRQAGIKKSILVLGPTLPNLLAEAAKYKIAITISTPEALAALARARRRPEFHLKLDTGMHRQGFYIETLGGVIQRIQNPKSKIQKLLTGAYTHFSSAKDLNYPTFTDLQFHKFKTGLAALEAAGFKNFLRHASATGAVLISQEYNLDAVRTGIGLYGLWPSKELEVQRKQIGFRPALSWQAIVSEVKEAKNGDYIGYDLAERIYENKKIAVVPIGYWHGFPRALSSVGEVVVNGHRARVLGRVSMDMITVDVTGVNCRAGDIATIIGRQKGQEISAGELAQKTGTTHYEIITRINPLIERVIK